jgi:hypothetical protein
MTLTAFIPQINTFINNVSNDDIEAIRQEAAVKAKDKDVFVAFSVARRGGMTAQWVCDNVYPLGANDSHLKTLVMKTARFAGIIA